MKCIFVEDKQISGEFISVLGGDLHHITHVYRLEKEESIEIKDPTFAYRCVIHSIQKNEVIFRILDKRKLLVSPISITLCQSILKHEAFDILLRKATELGVNKIIPYQAENSVVRVKNKDWSKHLTRWRKICEEGSKQCGRDFLPVITDVINDLNNIKNISDQCIIGMERECRSTYKSVLQTFKMDKEIIILVGPEGSLSDRECQIAFDIGFRGVTLMDSILKSDTASLFMISGILYHFQQG